MLDLMMLGWPWFAGAGALGALTGFVTSSRDERTAAVAPGWMAVALVLALGAGVATSVSGIIEARMAVTFDIALAMSAAYVFGLPVGRAFKLLDAPQESGRVTPSRPVAVPPDEAPAPHTGLASVEQIAAFPAADPAPALEEIAAGAKALETKAAEMRVRVKSAKKPSRQRPPTLDAPLGAADDLTRIKGLGPKSARKLNALGIFHYDQIAGWSRDNARWIGVEIGVAGRVERDEWVAQARRIAGKDEDMCEEKSVASAA